MTSICSRLLPLWLFLLLSFPVLAQTRADSATISERIDGPANIREAVNGKLLFQLEDNVPVSSTDTTNKWCKISLLVDINRAHLQSGRIPKGSKLISGGVEVGMALADIKLQETDEQQGKLTGEITGYTSWQNIKAWTQPENALNQILSLKQPPTLADLQSFLKNFQFTPSAIGDYKGYQLDGGIVYGPSTPLRLFLVFDKNKLVAIVHLRKMAYKGSELRKADSGYYITVIGKQPAQQIDEFCKQFNSFINAAG